MFVHHATIAASHVLTAASVLAVMKVCSVTLQVHRPIVSAGTGTLIQTNKLVSLACLVVTSAQAMLLAIVLSATVWPIGSSLVHTATVWMATTKSA